MLVDDNKIDLFVNQKIIEKVQMDTNIRKFLNPVTAINFLKILDNGNADNNMEVPDIIFLDINMPEMDGFQFLEEFNKLVNINKRCIKIYILSSSTYNEDIQKAKKIRTCVGYLNKPLSSQSVKNILTEIKFNYNSFYNEKDDKNICHNR